MASAAQAARALGYENVATNLVDAVRNGHLDHRTRGITPRSGVLDVENGVVSGRPCW